MNSHLRIVQLLLQQTPSNILSPRHLFQLHSQLLTTGLYTYQTSTHLQILKLYLSNPSIQPQVAKLFYQIEDPNKWNLMIRYFSATNPVKALSLFQEMLNCGQTDNPNYPFQIDPFVYASVIKACGKAHVFLKGKSIHCHVIRAGLGYNLPVLNSLICFYLDSVTSISYAALLFDMISEKNVVTVNCMMSGHVKKENLDVGLNLFVKMLEGVFGSEVRPNHVSFVILLSGCAEVGRIWAGDALNCTSCKMGLNGNTEICNVLIDMYSKFGRVSDAATVFDSMPVKDLISWNSMVWGYANNGEVNQAFSLYRRMMIEKIRPDRVSFSCLISVCATLRDFSLGRMIHAHVRKTGLVCDVSIGTALIHMYAKCRKMDSASNLFDELPKENIELWNSMIHGYIENGIAQEAIKLFHQIKFRKLELDEVTILGLIRACRDTGQLDELTNSMHSILESHNSIILGNALIDIYAKCGDMERATDAFDRMPKKDVISWTSMIVGHAFNGEGGKCLATFRQMCAQNIVPNSVTFIGVLSACSHAGLVDEGRNFYNIMTKDYQIEPQIKHFGCVIDMLARAGKLQDAERFIKNMPIEPNTLVWRMLMNACRVHNRVDVGLNLVKGISGLDTSLDAVDNVISCNVYAEAGRWSDAESYRNSGGLGRVSKLAGKSSICY